MITLPETDRCRWSEMEAEIRATAIKQFPHTVENTLIRCVCARRRRCQKRGAEEPLHYISTDEWGN